MKTSFSTTTLALALFLASPALATLRATTTTDERELQAIDTAASPDEPCLRNGWSFSNDKSCSYEELRTLVEEKISGKPRRCGERTAERELELSLGLTGEEELKKHVHEICNNAWSEAKSLDGKGVDWLSITRKNRVFNKEYFDGNTFFNNERETENRNGEVVGVLEESPGERILGVYEGAALSKIIQWPGDEETEDKISNFEQCDLRAAMCCWTQDRQAGDGNGNCATPYEQNCLDADPADNTDLCYVDMARAKDSARVAGGFAIFPEDSEGEVHCHGLAWAADNHDASSLFKGNNLFYISMYDHLYKRGYANAVPGAPMCGCLEKMPVVTRSDCTEITAEITTKYIYDSITGELSAKIKNVAIDFNACQGADDTNNDLKAYYKQLLNDGKAEQGEYDQVKKHLVENDGNCDGAIREFASGRV